MIKQIKSLYKTVAHYFKNGEMYQILLKYNNGTELTIMEKQELDYWVYVYEHRNSLFKHLTTIIDLRNQLNTVKHRTDLYRFLDKVKQCVPAKYIDTTNDKDFFSIRRTVSSGLKSYSNELVLRLIRGHVWGAIISTFAVIILVSFFVFMIVRFS